MNDLHISFYLRANRIRVFADVLRALGSPNRICFMMDKTGENILIAPYGKRDFKSHKVPSNVYNGRYGMEVSSMKLCRIIAELHDWDVSSSYRVPGSQAPEKNAVIFRLAEAEAIAGKASAEAL